MNKLIKSASAIMLAAGIIAAGAILPGCSAQAAPDVAAASAQASVVLVHGAWADGSSWSQVIPLLQKQGVHVVAVQLGLNGLKSDADIVGRALGAQPGKVVLVGHSYGGAVITQAGGAANVVSLVYVAAFAPGDGESVNDLTSPFPAPPWQAGLVPDAAGKLALDVASFTGSFAPDLPLAQSTVLAALQGPLQATALAEKVDAAAWHNKPSRWVLSGADAMIPPAFQQAEATRIGARVTMVAGSSHVVMLSHPVEVANVILDAVAAAK